MGRNNSENFLSQQNLVRAESPQSNADLYKYAQPEILGKQAGGKQIDAATRARVGPAEERTSIVLNKGETFWLLAEQKYQVTGTAQNQAMQAILEANQLNAQVSKRNGRLQIVADTYYAGNTYTLPAQAEIPTLAHNFRLRVPGVAEPVVVAAAPKPPVEVVSPPAVAPPQSPVEVVSPPAVAPPQSPVETSPEAGIPKQPPIDTQAPPVSTNPAQPPVEGQNPPEKTVPAANPNAYMEVTARELEKKHLQTQMAFDEDVKKRGWIGSTFDGLKNSWFSGSENSTNLASKALSYVISHDRGSQATRLTLHNEQAQIDELKRAAKEGNADKFNQAYLALTGSKFDARKATTDLKGESALMNYASSQHNGVEFLSDTGALIAATMITRRSPALTSNVLGLMAADATLTGVGKFGLKTATGDGAELKHDLLSGAMVGALAAPAEIVGGIASQKVVNKFGNKLGLDLVRPHTRINAELLEQRIATSELGWNLPGVAKWGLSSAAKYGTAGSVFGAGMPIIQESVDALTIKGHGFDLAGTAQRSLTGGLLGFPLGTGFGLLAKDRGPVGGKRTTPTEAPVETAAVTPEAVAPVETAAVTPEAVAPVETAAVTPEAVAPVETAAVTPEAAAPVETPAGAPEVVASPEMKVDSPAESLTPTGIELAKLKQRHADCLSDAELLKRYAEALKKSGADGPDALAAQESLTAIETELAGHKRLQDVSYDAMPRDIERSKFAANIEHMAHNKTAQAQKAQAAIDKILQPEQPVEPKQEVPVAQPEPPAEEPIVSEPTTESVTASPVEPVVALPAEPVAAPEVEPVVKSILDPSMAESGVAPKVEPMVDSSVQIDQPPLEAQAIVHNIAPLSPTELTQRVELAESEIQSLTAKLDRARSVRGLSETYADALEIDLHAKLSGVDDPVATERLQLVEAKFSFNEHTKDWVVDPLAPNRAERIADIRSFADANRQLVDKYEQQLAEAIEVRDIARTDLNALNLPASAEPALDAGVRQPLETAAVVVDKPAATAEVSPVEASGTPEKTVTALDTDMVLDQAILQNPAKRQDAMRDLHHQMLVEFTPGMKLQEYVKFCRSNNPEEMQAALSALDSLKVRETYPQINLDDVSEAGLAAMQRHADSMIASGRKAGQLASKYSREGRLYDEQHSPTLSADAVQAHSSPSTETRQMSSNPIVAGTQQPAAKVSEPKIEAQPKVLEPKQSKKQAKAIAAPETKPEAQKVTRKSEVTDTSEVHQATPGSVDDLKQQLADKQRVVEIVATKADSRTRLQMLWDENLVPDKLPPEGGIEKFARRAERDAKRLERQIADMEEPADMAPMQSQPVLLPAETVVVAPPVEQIPAVEVPLEVKADVPVEVPAQIPTEVAPLPVENSISVSSLEGSVAPEVRYQELSASYKSDFERMSTLKRELNKLNDEWQKIDADPDVAASDKQNIYEQYFESGIKSREAEREALRIQRQATRSKMDEIEAQLKGTSVAEDLLAPVPTDTAVVANLPTVESVPEVAEVAVAENAVPAVESEVVPTGETVEMVATKPVLDARGRFKILNTYKEIHRSGNREAIKASEKEMREAGMGDLIGKQEGRIKKRWEALRAEAAKEKAAEQAAAEKPAIDLPE